MKSDQVFNTCVAWLLTLPYADQQRIYNACLAEKEIYPRVDTRTIICAACLIERSK